MKINLFKIITLLCLLSSCVRTECKDCIKLFDTTLSNNELDSIVQNLPNNNTADSSNYLNWQEFIDLNISTLEHELGTEIEVCSKYGGMTSVDRLGDKEEEQIIWYSHGSSDLTLPHGELTILGTAYYDCK
tara:strand:- start:259 stop:651 length:393 start_codon:yes stop_codon:yes gene_type:complete